MTSKRRFLCDGTGDVYVKCYFSQLSSTSSALLGPWKPYPGGIDHAFRPSLGPSRQNKYRPAATVQLLTKKRSIFLSLGFGLPILEAMSCGCPVITTPWTSIPEVGGGAVMYVNDARSLSDALIEVQRPETRERLIAAGFERVERFRWDTMAAQIQNVCEQVIRVTEAAMSRRA
jgi:glycosyltransferase involved in cell wall biosynthesis